MLRTYWGWGKTRRRTHFELSESHLQDTLFSTNFNIYFVCLNFQVKHLFCWYILIEESLKANQLNTRIVPECLTVTIRSVVPGISPPVISPSRGQIPRNRAPLGQIPWDLALPARPPLGISPPPPSQRHISENILVFRPSYQEIWFGNLFDNGFARVRFRANVVWYFQKLELTT